MTSELECLEAAYRALLRLHFGSPFRMANQDILARLLGAIAERRGQDDEYVQNEFEAEAHGLTYVCFTRGAKSASSGVRTVGYERG